MRRPPFGKRDIPALICLLKDPEFCNRGDALVALGKLRARRALPAMARRLRDSNWVVRCDAAEALAAVGDRRAVPALRRALHSRNPLVRSYVAGALGDLRDTRSRAQFQSMYASRSARYRIVAAGVLYQLSPRPEYLNELGRLTREAARYDLRYWAFHSLVWVMKPRDKPLVRKWLCLALRTERESPGLRKDIRRALRGL